MHLLSTSFLTLCLLLAAPVFAGEPGEADRPKRGLGEHVLTRARGIGDLTGAGPTALQPVRGLYAAAYPIESLGFWAEGTGLALTRRLATYDLQGGAAWRIDDGIQLTVSYRVMGVDFGYDSDVEGIDVEPIIAAPFLGLAFDF